MMTVAGPCTDVGRSCFFELSNDWLSLSLARIATTAIRKTPSATRGDLCASVAPPLVGKALRAGVS